MAKKGILKIKNADGSVEQILPMTTAEHVLIPNTSTLNAPDVLTALENLQQLELEIMTKDDIDLLFDESTEED